jgi:hypothetical protein
MSTLPVSFTHAPGSPRVAASPFLSHHSRVYPMMTQRAPTSFEIATAEAIWSAYNRMPDDDGKTHAFTALSAATGGGKTTGAVALMTFLVARLGLTCAYVAPSIAVVEEVHQHLRAIQAALGGTEEKTASSNKSSLDVAYFSVAAWSTVHKVNASPRNLDEYRETGVIPSAQYTEAQFRNAQIVVTTHERWKHELLTEDDCGVLRCSGQKRTVVIVDEEPSLDQIIVRQPEDV